MRKERLKLPFPSVGPSTDKVLFFPVEFFFFTFFSFSFFVDTTKAQELSNTYAALPVSRRRAAGPGDDEGREYCCSRSKKSSSPSSFVFYPLDLHLDLLLFLPLLLPMADNDFPIDINYAKIADWLVRF